MSYRRLIKKGLLFEKTKKIVILSAHLINLFKPISRSDNKNQRKLIFSWSSWWWAACIFVLPLQLILGILIAWGKLNNYQELIGLSMFFYCKQMKDFSQESICILLLIFFS
jgi:hypothetical protein